MAHRGPNVNGSLQSNPPAISLTWAAAYVGRFSHASLNWADLLDGFFPGLSSIFSALDEISDYYTGALNCLSLFPPHDRTRHYKRSYTDIVLPVSLGLWLSLAPVVTYYCLMAFLLFSVVFLILGDYTFDWFHLCSVLLACFLFVLFLFSDPQCFRRESVEERNTVQM